MVKMATSGRATETAITGHAATGTEVRSTKIARGQSPKRSGHVQDGVFTATASGCAVCAAPIATPSAASATSMGRPIAGQGRGSVPATGLYPLSPVCRAAA